MKALLLCLLVVSAVLCQDKKFGASQDSKGCLLSAGYKWCEAEQSCVRPWELAQTAQIENTDEAFNLHCNAQTEIIGVGSDPNGCSSSYKWCESEQACVRPWELAQTAQIENTEEAFNDHCTVQDHLGGVDGNGCAASGGYKWCEKEQSCLRPWELAETAQIENTEAAFNDHCTVQGPLGGADENGCVASAGYKWCEKEQACLRPWELVEATQTENTEEAFALHCSDLSSCPMENTIRCFEFCGSSDYTHPECVNGRWNCPVNTVSGNTCAGCDGPPPADSAMCIDGEWIRQKQHGWFGCAKHQVMGFYNTAFGVAESHLFFVMASLALFALLVVVLFCSCIGRIRKRKQATTFK